MDVLTNFIIVIVLQYVHIWNHLKIYTLNLHMLYVNNVSIKLEKN